ncbi:MAG: MarR family transcriptional regulator [Deltaproteobacteria bacterium]|nr:MAG: MarR family transcriptional regulator [Deltaproteobacteria bacterium]
MGRTAEELRERQFIEEVGLWTESVGLPRMAGRVYGRLLICDPPEQSSAQLAEYLGASRASISTSTRLLLQLGMAEKVPVPGSRASYFAVRPESFGRLLEAEMERTRIARELMERGLRTLAHRPANQRRRVQELRDLFALFERELPGIVDRWRKQREHP